MGSPADDVALSSVRSIILSGSPCWWHHQHDLEEHLPQGPLSWPEPQQHGLEVKARLTKGQGVHGGKDNGGVGFNVMNTTFGLKLPGSH